LAVDHAGAPHIAFYDGGAANLRIAYLPSGAAAGRAAAVSGGWVVTTVQQGGDVGQYPSLRLDAQGHSHISYYDATNGDLLWAYHAGGAGKTFLPLVLSQRR
jgi:hypothetical protein